MKLFSVFRLSVECLIFTLVLAALVYVSLKWRKNRQPVPINAWAVFHMAIAACISCYATAVGVYLAVVSEPSLRPLCAIHSVLKQIGHTYAQLFCLFFCIAYVKVFSSQGPNFWPLSRTVTVIACLSIVVGSVPAIADAAGVGVSIQLESVWGTCEYDTDHSPQYDGTYVGMVLAFASVLCFLYALVRMNRYAAHHEGLGKLRRTMQPQLIAPAYSFIAHVPFIVISCYELAGQEVPVTMMWIHSVIFPAQGVVYACLLLWLAAHTQAVPADERWHHFLSPSTMFGSEFGGTVMSHEVSSDNMYVTGTYLRASDATSDTSSYAQRRDMNDFSIFTPCSAVATPVEGSPDMRTRSSSLLYDSLNEPSVN